MSRRKFVVKCIIRTQWRDQLLTVLDKFNARHFRHLAFFRLKIKNKSYLQWLQLIYKTEILRFKLHNTTKVWITNWEGLNNERQIKNYRWHCREMVLADKGNSHVWRFSPDLIFLTIYSSHFVGTRRGILPPKTILSVCNSIFFP